MQLNTLNRVIALFLVGGFVVALGAMAYESRIRSFLEPYSKLNMGAPAGVFLAVALLSLTALVGTIVDAIGNVSLRRGIRKLARSRFGCSLLLCANEFDEQDRWKRTFEQVVRESPPHAQMLARDQRLLKPLSAGIFFRSADKELAEWLTQHHSMYHLSANFAVVLLFAAMWCGMHAWYYATAASFAGAFLLATFALDNYLYTYHLAFRNAYLVLQDKQQPIVATCEHSGNAADQPVSRL